MLEMISLRTFRLETTTGHIIPFEANKPRMVVDAAVQAAMAAGCVPTDIAKAPFYDAKAKAAVEFRGDVRASLLFLVIKLLVERNASKDFDSGGNPKVAVIAERVGFEVTKKEVVNAYRQYQQIVGEGLSYNLHPSASNILRVLEAESKMELVELAAEFGLPEDEANGLESGELRKLLLVKFSGVAG